MSKPTPKQLAYLRTLAERCGETFAIPARRREASEEIKRLKGRQATSRADRSRERRQVARDMAERGPASTVRDDEITGYGSSARWR